MVQIYVIEKNNQPIYIGKTVGFSVRLYYHRKRFGKDITWFFIDEVEDEEWKFWEFHYINLFKSWGFNLENKNNGGGGPTKYSDEVRKIISEKKTGMKYNMTEEGKIGKSEKLTGIKRSKETCDKIGKTKIKPIIQYTLDNIKIKEYNSIKEAGESVKGNPVFISNIANHPYKTAYGFKWKYKN
jgi:hypothetical protein